MDFTLYWFMFPVSICVATCAMLSGIGGAALFTPIFILIFPLLGPEYPLSSTLAAIGTALLTETFGFTSGFIGYYRRRMIDFAMGARFLKLSVPIAILGAIVAHEVHEGLLVGGYALLVLVLAVGILFLHRHTAAVMTVGRSEPIGEERSIIDSDGREYVYSMPHLRPRETATMGVGAFLTGMVSVGIGEVIISQLTRKGVPVGIAAATSVFVVIVTVALASTTLVLEIINDGGVNAVPWNLVCYSIPGVLIGGQIGPRLQGRISQRAMELGIGILFLVLAVAMMTVALMKFGVL
jgi:uncharacterized membrane protein YfcA